MLSDLTVTVDAVSLTIDRRVHLSLPVCTVQPCVTRMTDFAVFANAQALRVADGYSDYCQCRITGNLPHPVCTVQPCYPV